MDLVESGETMHAAGLKEAGTVLHSEALLISNPMSKHKQLIKTLKTRIEGAIAAESKLFFCHFSDNR